MPKIDSRQHWVCSEVQTSPVVYSSSTFIGIAASLQLHLYCSIFSLVAWYPMIIGTLHDCHCKNVQFLNKSTYAPEFTVHTLSPLTCLSVWSCQSSPVSVQQLWHHSPPDSSVCGCAHPLEIHRCVRVMSGKSSSVNGTYAHIIKAHCVPVCRKWRRRQWAHPHTSSQTIVYLYVGSGGGNDTYVDNRSPTPHPIHTI